MTEKPFFGRLLNSPRLSWGVGTETGGGEMRFQHSNSSDGGDTVLFFQSYPETFTTSPSQTSLPFARAGPWGVLVPAPRTSSGSSRPLSWTRRRGPTAPASSRSSLPSPLCCRRPRWGGGRVPGCWALWSDPGTLNHAYWLGRPPLLVAFKQWKNNIYKYIVIRLEMLCPLIIWK